MVREKIGERIREKGIVGIALVVLVLFLGFGSLTTVPTGSRGVLLQFGAVKGVLNEGLNFKVPFTQHVVLMSVQTKKVQATCAAVSKDMQQVNDAKITVNYRVDPKQVASLYQSIGTAYENIIIVPAIQDSVKATTAKYTAEDLITQRSAAATQMKDSLQDKLRSYGLIIDVLNIENVEFSREFVASIEAKQVAIQQALKAQRDLERIKAEAEQKIVQAKAEAEALRIQKQEVTDAILRLREIEAQMKAIEKWDGKLPQMTTGAIPFINVSK